MQWQRTVPGASHDAALSLADHIGEIGRFPTPRSLANSWSLTPRCGSSGETERLGSITKEGSPLARYLLGQMVLPVLKRVATMWEWFRRIKQRRGVKIAKVAVMRRLTVIFWHMLTKQQPYTTAATNTRRTKSRRVAKSVPGND